MRCGRSGWETHRQETGCGSRPRKERPRCALGWLTWELVSRPLWAELCKYHAPHHMLHQTSAAVGIGLPSSLAEYVPPGHILHQTRAAVGIGMPSSFADTSLDCTRRASAQKTFVGQIAESRPSAITLLARSVNISAFLLFAGRKNALHARNILNPQELHTASDLGLSLSVPTPKHREWLPTLRTSPQPSCGHPHLPPARHHSSG